MINELQKWADQQMPDAEAFVEQEGDFYYIKWKNKDDLVGHICIENRHPHLYMISFNLAEDRQRQNLFKSFASFIPGYARNNAFSHLAVISANETMLNLIEKCGFERGQDPNDYFVDISMEDSPPEQYGNSRP